MRYRVLLGALAGLAVAALGAAVAVSAPAGDGFARHGDRGDFSWHHDDRLDERTWHDQPHDRRQHLRQLGGDNHVVWFKWKATASALIRATTLGSTHDTVLYLFRGGRLIACDDDDANLGTGCPSGGPDTFCSNVGFQSVEGKTYYFGVAAFGSKAGGEAHLNLTFDWAGRRGRSSRTHRILGIAVLRIEPESDAYSTQ
jgi:hypothetical protein